jgi:diguanylate cyclase (GGDEF)-like protein
MKSVVRRYDAIGRYGGEEFLIVLPSSEGESARMQAERIREVVASEPYSTAGTSFTVTCSIGVSCRKKPAQTDADSLVREADLALYQAKESGRNCVESYVQETTDALVPDLPGLAMAMNH